MIRTQMKKRLEYLENVYKLAYTKEGKSSIITIGCPKDWERFVDNSESEINALRGLLKLKTSRAFNGQL